jgi:hypothetical protein
VTTMLQRVETALARVQLFSRINDLQSPPVIEICRYGDENEPEIVVVSTYPSSLDETKVLRLAVRKARARAAIEAMRDPDHTMTAAILTPGASRVATVQNWNAMIDAALTGD